MKFIYDENVDKECKERLDACDLIFDQEKKTGVFPVTDEIIKKFESTWTPKIEKIFSDNFYEIFKINLSNDFKCYINSTPYSMDLKDGISLSASTETPIKTICHETNHYLFKKSIYPNKYFPNMDVHDSKEIFTVINNIYFQDIIEVQDSGWKKFWKERFNFLKIWIKDN